MTALEEIKKALEGDMNTGLTAIDRLRFIVGGVPDFDPITVEDADWLISALESLQRENEASEATATRYANEIIELRGELAKTASLLVVQTDRAEAAEADMKHLRETLHPFAEAADYYSTGVHRTPAPDALPCGPALIVAHLRAARTAIASTGGEHHGN